MATDNDAAEVAELDPVTYEVLRHRLWSVNEEHGLTIAQISGSPIVTLSHDFNPSIHLPNGEVVFSGPYIQYLNAGAGTMIEWILDAYGADFIRPGDVFLSNDPWIAVSHQLDVCVVAPVFAGSELLCWVANAVHQYDLGGTLPGSFTPQAKDIFEEAMPIPPVRIVEEGRMRPDIEAVYLRRSRLPHLLGLDLRAALGGCNVARKAIEGTVDEYGADVLAAAMVRTVDDADAAFVQRLGQIPEGRWIQEFFVESRPPDDGGVPELIRQAVSLAKEGDRLVFENVIDVEQDRVQSMTEVGFAGAAMAAVATALCADQLFAIGGAMRHVDFELKPGTSCNATFPSAMSCANMRVAQFTSVASHLVAKMQFCSPELMAGAVGAGASAGLPVMLISGVDADGAPYGTALSDHMAGGVAPALGRDGVDSGGHSWDPRSLVPNVEDQELVFPILYLYRHELADSGGAGERRGANGGAFAYVPLEVDEISVATVTAGAATRVPASPGLLGGYAGGTSAYRIARGAQTGELRLPWPNGDTPDWQAIPAAAVGLAQRRGDAVEERWCGSGGLGDPLDRTPDQVVRDVEDGRSTIGRAHDVHGVVIAAGAVDETATAERRDAVRHERTVTSEEPSQSADAPDGVAIGCFGDRLEVRDGDSGAVWTCSCGHGLAPLIAGFRAGCRRRRRPLTEVVDDLAADAGTTDALELHEFFCPGCLRLHAADVTLAGAEPENDVVLAAG